MKTITKCSLYIWSTVLKVDTKTQPGFLIGGRGIFMRATTIMLRGNLNQIIKFFTRKISYLVDVLGKLMYINRITAGGSPPVARWFLWFLIKNSHLNHISHVFRSTWKNVTAKIWKELERIKLLTHFSPSTLPMQVKSSTLLNACIYELNFRSDGAKTGVLNLFSPISHFFSLATLHFPPP